MNDRLETLLSLWKKTNRFFVRVDRWLFLERLFLLFTCLAVIYFVWYLVLMMPVQKTQNRLKTRIVVSQRQIQALERKTETIVAQAIIEAKHNRQQHKILSEKVKILNQEIARFNKRFMTAAEMAPTLRATMDKQEKLQLQSLVTLPVRMIVKPTEGEQKLTEQGVTVTFQGGYLNTLSYLQELEKLKTQILWDNLRYNVVKYPGATIVMTLFLLNPPKGSNNG